MELEIKPFGEAGLLINLEQILDPEINATVMALDEAIHKQAQAGIQYTLPAYASLTVVFNPEIISYRSLKKSILELALEVALTGRNNTLWNIPVCYHPGYGIDLEDLAAEINLSPEQIISFHANTTYRVYMLGFIPGFAYMGITVEELRCFRRQIPRNIVPAGSIGLAGKQTGIYPADVPGGWQIIGKTALRTFLPEHENPFPLKQGDEVKFIPISKEEHMDLESQTEKGDVDIYKYVSVKHDR